MNAGQALLFDLDGTLYHQRPLRLAMARSLAAAHWRRPAQLWRTARALQSYRQAQEHLRVDGSAGARAANPASLGPAQLTAAVERSGLPAAFVAACVAEWMEQRPLALLPRFLRQECAEMLRAAKAAGVATAVCSDYPARDKLAALGLERWIDVVVTAQDDDVGEFKPSPKMLQVALRRLGIAPERAVYVGDRPEVDGEAARRAGVAFRLAGEPGESLRVAAEP